MRSMTATPAAEINQSSAGNESDPQDRRKWNMVMVRPVNLNGSHINCLLVGRVGESAVNQRGNSDEHQYHSSEFHD